MIFFQPKIKKEKALIRELTTLSPNIYKIYSKISPEKVLIIFILKLNKIANNIFLLIYIKNKSFKNKI